MAGRMVVLVLAILGAVAVVSARSLGSNETETPQASQYYLLSLQVCTDSFFSHALPLFQPLAVKAHGCPFSLCFSYFSSFRFLLFLISLFSNTHTAPPHISSFPLRCSDVYFAPHTMCCQQVCYGRHTIHGLWPQWANNCPGPAFNIRALSSLTNKLNNDWPSCVGTGGNVAFWQHEWEKHGTCSKLSLQSYFSTTLSLYS